MKKFLDLLTTLLCLSGLIQPIAVTAAAPLAVTEVSSLTFSYPDDDTIRFDLTSTGPVTAFTIRATFRQADSAYIRTVPLSNSVR